MPRARLPSSRCFPERSPSRGGVHATADDFDLSVAHEARCYTAEDLTRLGVRAVSLDVRERLHGKPVYVSFDVDAIDPAFAPEGLALLGVAP
jgi:arginase family enzyme